MYIGRSSSRGKGIWAYFLGFRVWEFRVLGFLGSGALGFGAKGLELTIQGFDSTVRHDWNRVVGHTYSLHCSSFFG